MEPLVVYVYSYSAGYQPDLEKQLDKAKVDRLPVQIDNFSWRTRALKTMDVAREHIDRVLIFVDAWDTLFLGSKEELMALRLDDGITLAASKVCWPDVDRYTDYNKKQAFQTISAWRYVNSNPMAGLGRNIAEAMEWCWERWPIKGDSCDVKTADGEVCERFFTHAYLDSPFKIKVDTMCRLNQIWLCSTPGDLYLSGNRIYNCMTGSSPVFLHMNGGHKMDLSLFQ